MPRIHHITVETRHYDETTGEMTVIELHYRVARPNRESIRSIKRRLTPKLTKHAQRFIRSRTGKRFPLDKMRVKFENPVPAKRISNTVRFYATSIVYVGKRRRAKDLGTSTFPYPTARKRHSKRRGRKTGSRKAIAKNRSR